MNNQDDNQIQTKTTDATGRQPTGGGAGQQQREVSEQTQIGSQPVKTVTTPPTKERKELGAAVDLEKVPVVELAEEEQVPEEVESWIERLEKAEEIQLPKPVTDDQGQTLVSPIAPQEPEIVLPLTKEEVKTGLHYKVWDSLLWLAQWCVKIIKKYRGKVSYREGHGRI